MEINPHNKYLDSLGNLYRAALYLGRGNTALGRDFLNKALSDERLGYLRDRLKLNDSVDRKQELLIAEKALDEYQAGLRRL